MGIIDTVKDAVSPVKHRIKIDLGLIWLTFQFGYLISARRLDPWHSHLACLCSSWPLASLADPWHLLSHKCLCLPESEPNTASVVVLANPVCSAQQLTFTCARLSVIPVPEPAQQPLPVSRSNPRLHHPRGVSCTTLPPALLLSACLGSSRPRCWHLHAPAYW